MLVDFDLDLDKIALKVYEGSDSDLIWNDRKSGGKYNVGIYRAKGPDGYYSLGDIGVRGYGEPRTSHLTSAVQSDALQQPIDFRQRWNDKGSGAKLNVGIWEPVCSAGYVPIGHVAVRSKNTRPEKTDIMCVKYDYVTEGEWEWVWNDRKTGSKKDVSIWKAIATSKVQQGVNAMAAIGCRHCEMDLKPYVLKAENVQYIAGKPATKYVLQNVVYLFDDREALESNPEELARTIIENRGTTEQTATRTIEYSYEESHNWSQEYGLEIGIETSVTAGVPDVSSATVRVTHTALVVLIMTA